MRQHTGLAAAAMVAVCVGASAAHAGASRVWVSGHGVDQAGCGAPTAPCRSLQYAHDNAVNAGGEIDILDPAGYGAVTITKSVSIVNDGVGTAGVQSGDDNAITISAGPNDAVFLKGLNIDGLQGGGFIGVRLASGGKLTIVDCTVRHFSTAGIQVEEADGTVVVNVADTWSSDNQGAAGFAFLPLSGTGNVSVKLDRFTADGNDLGIDIDARDDTGGSISVIANQVRADQNTSEGARIDGDANNNIFFETDTSEYTQNGVVGLDAVGGANVYISRSVFSRNGDYSVDNELTSGSIHSFGDSAMTDPLHGPALVSSALH
jgi:hypothetical protein